MPTLKDLDWQRMHAQGISMNPDARKRLIEIVENDSKMLKEIGTMDYSFLLFIRYEEPSTTSLLSNCLVKNRDASL